MSRRRRRREGTGTGAIVRAIRKQGDRIVRAIERTSEDAAANRAALVGQCVDALRAALDDAGARTFVAEPAGPGGPKVMTIHPRPGNDAGTEPAPMGEADGQS